jgi:uncharacterized protein YecE (DUF72 family)
VEHAPRGTGRLRFGTSSWSEPAWVGPFYPVGTPPGDFLRSYATRFDTVEADVTYYRVPSRSMVAGWNGRTPDGFVLSAKFPRTVVHGGPDREPDPARVLALDAVEADATRFLEAMSELGAKTGPLVLQFPYFNRRAFASAGPFLERLDRFLDWLPRDRRYAVEVRNRAWLDVPLAELLRRHAVALVLVDHPFLPHPAEWRIDPVTTDFAYVRLIGDRQATEAAAERFDRVVVDHGARLERWASTVRELLRRVPLAFAYANNHFAGYAPETIRTLAARVLADPPDGAPPGATS